MINFKLTQSSEKINSLGGLPLIGRLLKKSGLLDFQIKSKCRKSRISDSDILVGYSGLLAQGKTEYEEISAFRDNAFFKDSLGLTRVPSAESLRQRLDEMGRFDFIKSKLSVFTNIFLKEVTPSTIKILSGEYTPLDIDGTPFDNSGSKKENVSRTYKGCDGFLAMNSFLGNEGYMVHNDLYPGSQHCQKGFPAFLRRSIKNTNDIISKEKQILVRLDSGHDAASTIEELQKHHNCSFIIKRNIRKEKKEWWLDIAKSVGNVVSEKEGYKRYIGFLSHLCPGNKENNNAVSVAFSVSVTNVDKNGQGILFPEIKVETYWTNLPENPEVIFELYHNHGTSEQFHSELKTDMDFERLPSKKFATNKLLFRIAMLVYNALRRIGIDMLEYAENIPVKINVKRRRIRSVLQDIIYSACKYVATANAKWIKFGVENRWWNIIDKLYLKYA